MLAQLALHSWMKKWGLMPSRQNKLRSGRSPKMNKLSKYLPFLFEAITWRWMSYQIYQPKLNLAFTLENKSEKKEIL